MAAEERRVERIVIALGSEALAAHALETAARLAKGLAAPLAGLLVENEQLLRLAELPSALEMGFPSARVRPIDRLEIERSLRLRAERTRRMLAEISARLALVEWSLEVIRGDLLREALHRALPADLVVVWRGAPYGDALLQARVRAAGPPLRAGPVALLVDAGDTDRRAVRAAHALARELGTEVLTLVAARHADAVRRVRLAHERLLGEQQSPRARYVQVARLEPKDLGRLLRAERAEILIVSGSMTREELFAYCAEISCPVSIATGEG